MRPSVDKGYKGMGMEGRIAAWYARNTAHDMADFADLAKRVLPRAYSRHQFAAMGSNSDFAGARIEDSGIGFEVTLQKHPA